MEETYACGALSKFCRLLGLSGAPPRERTRPPHPAAVQQLQQQTTLLFESDYLPFPQGVKEDMQQQESALEEFDVKEDKGGGGGEEEEEDGEEEEDCEDGGGEDELNEADFIRVVQEPRARSTSTRQKVS